MSPLRTLALLPVSCIDALTVFTEKFGQGKVEGRRQMVVGDEVQLNETLHNFVLARSLQVFKRSCHQPNVTNCSEV